MDTKEQNKAANREHLENAFSALLFKFSLALLKKLMRNEEKYGFGWNWKKKDWLEKLKADLRKHIEKGDPIDVAIYAFFAWFHKWETGPVVRTLTYTDLTYEGALLLHKMLTGSPIGKIEDVVISEIDGMVKIDDGYYKTYLHAITGSVSCYNSTHDAINPARIFEFVSLVRSWGLRY